MRSLIRPCTFLTFDIDSSMSVICGFTTSTLVDSPPKASLLCTQTGFYRIKRRFEGSYPSYLSFPSPCSDRVLQETSINDPVLVALQSDVSRGTSSFDPVRPSSPGRLQPCGPVAALESLLVAPLRTTFILLRGLDIPHREISHGTLYHQSQSIRCLGIFA